MLTAASARLAHPVAALAVERIRLFHSARFLARRRLPKGVTLLKLNDAIVASVDIEVTDSPTLRLHDDPYHGVGYDEVGSDQAWTFLLWVRNLHDEIRNAQRASGYPGARTIVAFDRRLSGTKDTPLNLNMAFAFAYKAEEEGSAKGFSGDHLYAQLRPYEMITSTLNIAALEERVPIRISALGRTVEFFRCPRRPKPGTGIMARLFSDHTMTDLTGDPLPPASR